MQIYELHNKLTEDVLTPAQINQIFIDVERASTTKDTTKVDQGPIAAASELTPRNLVNKGISALGRALKPKISAEHLSTIWAGMRNEPTTDNLSRMLAASGVNPKVIRDTLRRNVPAGPTAPVTATKPSPATVSEPAPPAAAPATAAPIPSQKFTSPMQVVDAIVDTMPKAWLPEITAELLKRQRVSATKR